jgi:serine/threonine protein phosphatase 1
MYRRFVIGDIHGCIKTLEKLLFEILAIDEKDLVFFVGDYIDRGPGSKQVVNLINSFRRRDYNLFPVRGNHEQMLLDYYKYNDETWLYNGYKPTLLSYGLDSARDLDYSNLRFFSELKHYYITDGFIITHAGLNTSIENPFHDLSFMLWTRESQIDRRKTNGRRVISGHTPHSIDEIEASLGQDKIQIDCGCVYLGRHPGTGYLCALDLDTMQLFKQINIDFE